MSRYAARAALLLIATAVVTGFYFVRVKIQSRPWPITTFHPRLLVFIAVVAVEAVSAGVVVIVAIVSLRELYRKAEL